MFREFFLDRTRTDRLVAWVGLLLVIGQAIYSSVIKFQINEWYNDFYNLLQTSGKHLMANATASSSSGNATMHVHSLADGRQEVWRQLVVLGWIVLPLVIVYPIAKWVRSNWALHWRMCLMRSYMEAWDPNAPHGLEASFGLCCDTAL